MTCRLTLAWATGATLGLVVGWVAADFAAMARPVRHPERRTQPRTGMESHQAPIGPQTGAQPCQHQRRVDITTYGDLPTRRQVCTDCGVTIFVASVTL